MIETGLKFETVHFFTTKYVMNLTRALSQLFLREFKMLTSGITCDRAISNADVLHNRAKPTELMFILIPQLLICSDDAVPDPNKYCIYQLEQINYKRGDIAASITKVKTDLESPLMISVMNGSLASYDYSAINLPYYPASLLSKVRVLPPPVYICGAFHALRDNPVDIDMYKSDILFYGGMNPRRLKILSQIIDPLQKGHGYKLTVVNQVFGEELLKYIYNTRVVLNIHYYVNSILETDRLHAAMQFGHVKLVSEYPTHRDELLSEYTSHRNRILFCSEISDRFVNTAELIKTCVRALSSSSLPLSTKNASNNDDIATSSSSSSSSSSSTTIVEDPLLSRLNSLCTTELKRHITS